MAAGAASESGDPENAIALARDGIEAFRLAGDPVDVARATARLGEVLLNSARVGPAIDVLEPALAGLPDEAPDEARARLAAMLSRAYMRADEPAKSIAAADIALVIAERLGLDQVLADALNNKGSSLSQLGRTQEGTALLAGAVEIAARGGFVATELRARSNLSSTTWDRDPRRALVMVRETLDLARRFGSRQTANWVLGMAITAGWLRADDWDRVLAEGAEALADARALDDQIGLQLGLSSIRLARGDRCDDLLEHLRQLPDELASDPMFSKQLPFLLAERAILAGDDRTAILEYRRAAAGFAAHRQYSFAEASYAAFRLGDVDELRRLADELDGLPGADLPTSHVERLRTRAWLAALEGREDEAVVGLHRVLEAYRDLGYDFFLARTILDSTRVLGADALGSALVAEARAIFERVGATPYLAWLDAAVAGSRYCERDRPPRARRTGRGGARAGLIGRLGAPRGSSQVAAVPCRPAHAPRRGSRFGRRLGAPAVRRMSTWSSGPHEAPMADYDEAALLIELEPEAGRLLDRHLEVAAGVVPARLHPLPARSRLRQGALDARPAAADRRRPDRLRGRPPDRGQPAQLPPPHPRHVRRGRRRLDQLGRALDRGGGSPRDRPARLPDGHPQHRPGRCSSAAG